MIHDYAEERCRLWALQSVRPTQDRADRIVQLTRFLNGHADDVFGLPGPLWWVSSDDKRQVLDYARPGGLSADQRKERAEAKAGSQKGRIPQVPRLRPPR